MFYVMETKRVRINPTRNNISAKPDPKVQDLHEVPYKY
jgi:hypothetical protein